jgi:hypothetical protein
MACFLGVFTLIGFVLQFAAFDASHGGVLSLDIGVQNVGLHLDPGGNHDDSGNGHQECSAHATCSASVGALNHEAAPIERSGQKWNPEVNKHLIGWLTVPLLHPPSAQPIS